MLNPHMIKELGKIRQQEILKDAERARMGEPLPPLRNRLGKLLIAIGQKLVIATNLGADRGVISAPAMPQVHNLGKTSSQSSN